MFDILIIGGGLAGAMAALAAKRQGASVGLAARSWGATAMSTGALDIAYTPALSPVHQVPRTLTDHMKDIIAHRPRHPYGILGVDQAVKALMTGYGVLAEGLQAAGLDAGPVDMQADNVGLPSSLGTILPAAGAMAPHRGFSLANGGRWGVLQLARDGYFDAARLCRGLRRDAEAFYGKAPEMTPISVPYGAGPSPMATARVFDDRAHCETLMRQLQGKVQGLDGLLVPPVMGLDQHHETRTWLSENLGMPVVEALAHLPSVPGVRLQRVLEHMLRQAGVASIGEVAGARTEGAQVQALITKDNLEISAGAFVLATGRFISGGVRWGATCQEAVFGLPIVTELGWFSEDSPHNVVRETPVESHPLMTAGVKVTRRLQPVREGRPAFNNLFAAGMIIGGFASRYTLCADGVALATGWLAGSHATMAMRGT